MKEKKKFIRPAKYTKLNYNKIVYIDDKIVKLKANYKEYSNIIFIIDRDDLKKIIKWKWYLIPRRDKTNKYYVYSALRIGSKKFTIYLHRYLKIGLNFDKREIDHKNHDPLDCRKNNLRFATRAQQSMNQIVNRKNNTSGYKGVGKINNKWYAYIWDSKNKRNQILGYSKYKKDAAILYNKAAEQKFGRFAELNNI